MPHHIVFTVWTSPGTNSFVCANLTQYTACTKSLDPLRHVHRRLRAERHRADPGLCPEGARQRGGRAHGQGNRGGRRVRDVWLNRWVGRHLRIRYYFTPWCQVWSTMGEKKISLSDPFLLIPFKFAFVNLIWFKRSRMNSELGLYRYIETRNERIILWF